jgi:hypothetical protein
MSGRLVDVADMALRGRIGAHRLHATHDSREITQAARTAFLSKFLAEADPDGVLPEAERLRRAEHARKAYFARLALKSARARSRSRNARTAVVGRTAAAAVLEGGVRDGHDPEQLPS